MKRHGMMVGKKNREERDEKVRGEICERGVRQNKRGRERNEGKASVKGTWNDNRKEKRKMRRGKRGEEKIVIEGLSEYTGKLRKREKREKE